MAKMIRYTPLPAEALTYADRERRRYAIHKETGKLLHFTGVALTTEPAYAWHGTLDQFRKLCDKLDLERTAYRIRRDPRARC